MMRGVWTLLASMRRPASQSLSLVPGCPAYSWQGVAFSAGGDGGRESPELPLASFLSCWRSGVATGGFWFLRTGRHSLGIRVMLTFTAVMDARVCVWEETMFLLARYTVAAAVFLSASLLGRRGARAWTVNRSGVCHRSAPERHRRWRRRESRSGRGIVLPRAG